MTTTSRPGRITPHARPRLCGLRPPVRRAPDAVQFGTDPRRALVLEGLTPPLRRMVGTLDGTRRTGEVIADAVALGVGPGSARAVLDDLGAAGLLGGPGRAAGPRSVSVLVRGGGRLAVALAGVLVGAGVHEVGLDAGGRVELSDTGTGLTDADVGLPTAEAVARRVPGVRPGPCPRPDLVVLAPGSAVEPAVADALVARGRAHLAVAVRDGVGLVGPLVLPRRGSCVRCAELARTDADPAWPSVLAQLVVSPPPMEVADAMATAALAAAQVRSALSLDPADGGFGAGSGPASLGGVLELDLDRGSLSRTRVPVHPACPCGGAARGPAPRSVTAAVPDPVYPTRSVMVGRVA